MAPSERELERIDVHSVEVAAAADEVWSAAWRVVARSFSGPLKELVATLLGCDSRRAENITLPRPGATTLAGFRITGASAPHRFVLAGSHRFARYRLTFRVEESGGNSCRVAAETEAAFPGIHGALYRALVVGSRGHVVVVRRMLRNIERLVESDGRRPSGER